MRKGDIVVGWSCKRDFDFGMFNDAYKGGEIKVNATFWENYVQLRMNFEKLHEQLFEKVPEKIRKKTRQFDASLQPILCCKCAEQFKEVKE